MPVDVVHLNLARGFRGGERQTELLVRELAAAGFAQRLVGRGGEPLVRRLAGVAGLEIVERGPGLLGAAAAIGATRLVHVHEGRSGYAAWLRRRLAGTPYLITRRVPNPLGRRWLTRRVYRDAAAVVGISAAICRGLVDYEPSLRPYRVPSAASGLRADPAAVARLREGWNGAFIVGHVGALDDDQKGQSHLIAAARALACSCPALRVVLVGGGADEARLRAAAAGLENVEFTGFVEDVGNYLAAFDLFVFPSNREGLGSILLDAMQFGLPIVASRVGGIPELVRDAENGLLVPAGDVGALAAAIRQLHDDARLRGRMGRRSLALGADFTPAAMARQYRELYQQLAERGAS